MPTDGVFDGIGCLCERDAEFGQPGDPSCTQPDGCVTEICAGPGTVGDRDIDGWDPNTGCMMEDVWVYDAADNLFSPGTRSTCDLGAMLGGGTLLDFYTELDGGLGLTLYDVADPDHAHVRCVGPGLQIDCYFPGEGRNSGLGSPSFENDRRSDAR